MRVMQPRVLLFSTTTGYQLRSFNDAAERLGIELMFATDRCQEFDDPWRDRAIAVRFHDEARSLEDVVGGGPFHGVLAVGDRPTILAAQAAERLGLQGNPPHAAAASGNKLETRARLGAAGLAVPAYFTMPASEPGWRAASDPRVEFPCVLKPLGLSGSRGVIRADSPSGFARAFDRIRTLLSRVDVRAGRSGLDRMILVERFIEGREVAVEGVLTAGTLQVFTIFDKPDPLDGPFFEETIYLTPTSLESRHATNSCRRFSRPPTRLVSGTVPSTRSVASVLPGFMCWKSQRVQSAVCVRRRFAFRVTSRSSRCCCAMPSAKTSPASLANEPRRQ